MTREELINKICPENNKYNCDDKRCEDCDELLNEWLDEYEQQIRSDLIEEVNEVLHKGIFTDEKVKNIRNWIAEQLEEQNK